MNKKAAGPKRQLSARSPTCHLEFASRPGSGVGQIALVARLTIPRCKIGTRQMC